MDFENETAYEELIELSLKEILRHEDFSQFLSWMRKKINTPVKEHFPSPPVSHLDSVATSMALGIWNATPLPGNGFRPKTVPIPKRNEPCFCGSGKKYKKCCSMGKYQLLNIEEEMIWPILFEVLPKSGIEKGLKDGSLPLNGLVLICAELLGEGRNKKILQLLEDYYFASSHKETNEHAAFGLTILFDALDMEGMRDRKIELIHHICAVAPPSPLRSEALQRLSTIQADTGNLEEAFKTLKKARKDTPGETNIGLLEVQLLLVKGDLSLAQQRARFVHKQISRQDADFPDDLYENPALIFLENVIKDPEMAVLEMNEEAGTSIEPTLTTWIEEAQKRPAVPYKLNEEAGLAAMQEDTAASRPHFLAHPPAPILKTDTLWVESCPVEQVFSTHLVPFEDNNPWDDSTKVEWQNFLTEHPEAFDSITIIDDLLTMIHMHPAWGQNELMQTIFIPTLHRGLEITRQCLESLPKDACLPWLATENRPFLRTLLRALIHAQFSEQHAEQTVFAKQLLHLNPYDNHGIRSSLINQYLQENLNQEALQLADDFPDDMLPEILYGRVLALYRLERKEEAFAAALEAKAGCPRVASYLIAPQRKEPQEESPFGMTMGGKQEAWEYRQAMRDTWKATRGILTWLKKV